MKKPLLLLISFSLLLFISCNNDDDGQIENPNPNPPVATDFPVQNFMWQAMNLWYFWQAEVPNLADDRFASNTEYAEFLGATPDPGDFFASIQFNEDRFSFSNSDYTTLVNNLNGVSKSNGLEFGLVRFGSADDVFGYVRYIIPNSDAATKDIQRGDIFTRVNGTQITGANFADLLFGDDDTYTLGLAVINGNTIEDTTEEVTLTKFEGLTENPILVSTTFDVGGTTVAYLMYNGFTRDFDDELNDAFGGFVAAGATELVLDFRYNPGGSVNSSRLLSSMIYGTNTNDLYIRQRWNAKIQNQLSSEQLEDYFASTVNGATLNSLNLSKVYIIATNSSASASELVMNGLEPYVDVIHIGETTRGKNEFSITMVDDSQNNFIYNRDREGNINPENSWAIQPLVGRNENADGFFDYTDGLTPDIVLEEDLTNLGVLGDVSEPLLARALQEISSTSTKMDFNVQMPARVMMDSKMFTPTKDNMWLDKPLNLELQ
ncbi:MULTISPECIES: S41 family peptidase [unclassified Croceitalea]|uniref:S41 family peptidase n=1 Tax=unclassified Croceitalea TaxID=2632280 RepID=UPI0030D75D5C